MVSLYLIGLYVKNCIEDKTITDIGLDFIWQIIFDALVVSVYLALQNQNALCYSNDVRFPSDKFIYGSTTTVI